MPPPVKRDECVILFDLNVPPDFFAKARECLLDVYGRKWCSESKDYVCLLPFGQKPVINTDFLNYRPANAEQTITKPEANDGLIVKALLHAVEVLESRYFSSAASKGVVTYKLLCISDFSNTKFEKGKAYDELIEKLNKFNVFLYILGPEVRLTETLNTWQDVHNWGRNPDFEADIKTQTAVKELAQAVKHSLVSNLKLGLSLFCYYKNYLGPQPNLVPLKAGTRFTFENRDLRALKKFSYPVLKSNQEFKFVLAENEEIEVHPHEVVNGLYCCEKMITMTEDVRDFCKSKGERAFKILGFTERKSIARWMFTGDGTHLIVPSDNWTMGLIHILKEKDFVAITAKRVMKNTKPKIWCLIPSDECFYAVQMPYGNHIRKIYQEKEPSVEHMSVPNANSEHERAICDYLDRMELSVAEVPLNFKMINNPAFKRWWRFMTQKSAGREFEFKEELMGKTASLGALTKFWPERELSDLAQIKSEGKETKEFF